MKRKIYKGGVDNYPFWWYGQSNRLQNFGDRTNFLTPHGAVFERNGYYFNNDDLDYLEDIYGRHLIAENTRGIWSQLYLTNSEVPPCGSIVGTGSRFYLAHNQNPRITGKLVLYPEYCPNINYLSCRDNYITTLDISRIKTTADLYCQNNQISVLDVSKLLFLNDFHCCNNLISVLDVSNLINLVYFFCGSNQISSLDTSQLIDLFRFACDDNFIPSLDVSNNSKIATLYCQNNLFDQAAVDKVLCDADAWNTSGGTLDISGNTAPSQTGIDAKNDMVDRNWTVTTD